MSVTHPPRPIASPHRHRLVRWSPDGVRGLPLVCFPWAGAGAGAFIDWPAQMPAHVEVWAARAAGRESRIGEPPVSDVATLVGEFATALEHELADEVVLFGHCSGALVALELGVELTRRARLRVAQLLVAAQAAPSSPLARERCGDVREELRMLGFPEAQLSDAAELIELLRPAIEADFELVTGYRRGAPRRLEAPITAFVGRSDTLVPRDSLAGWAEETSGRFECVELDGDHLFTGHHRRTLQAAIAERLAGLSQGTGANGRSGR